jgi:ADP-ribosylglycohydrolase
MSSCSSTDPFDTKRRLERAYVSLEGLAVGDGFGEMHFSRPASARERIDSDGLPGGPWWHTDDTEMAMAIYEVLAWHGGINQDSLASRFTSRFMDEPDRGYGKMARMILQAIHYGEDWKTASRNAFSGSGSMGNGGAMRVAPLGAYFAGDHQQVVREAKLSAEVTHSHPDGIAGAVAVAVAASVATENRGQDAKLVARRLLEVACELTPEGDTKRGVLRAAKLPLEATPQIAAKILGSGFQVTAPDTVPFTLWCAARHLDNYTDAMVSTLLGEGDCDTNCAIVGGIVACFVGREGIPSDWLAASERLKLKA